MPKLSNDWTLEFAAQTGGSVKSCTYQGHQILRPAISAGDPRETSAFPIAPFIGRITNGAFAFNGNAYQLTANMPPEPHAIHGRAWQSPWEIGAETGGQLSLAHAYSGEADWPWPYRARQSFSASTNTLTLKMSLTNEGKTPMPAGLGWHPYFPKSGAQIQADISQIWSGNTIANQPQPLSPETDLRLLRPVSQLALDHCFTAGENGALLVWPERGLSLKMTASQALRHLTVYTPPGEDYFCVEPVSHTPDAVNSALPAQVTGLLVLQPGKTLEASITLTVGKL